MTEPDDELAVEVVSTAGGEERVIASAPLIVVPRPRVRSLRRLLDPSLDDHLTPLLLPYLFVLLTALVMVVGCGLVIGAFVLVWWLGLIALVVVPVGAIVAIVVIRIVCEVLMTFSLMAQRTGDMSALLSRVETTVDGVASDMPPLGFLRLRRRNTDHRDTGG